LASPKLKESLPLYKALANALTQRIYEGDWAVGSNLPPEATLCKSFEASRHTLRHALQNLERDGLVLRRQGAPTQVISRRKVRRFTQSFNSPIDILSYPRDTYRENVIEEFIELDKSLSEMIGGAVGSSWYHIGGLRKQRNTKQVIAWTDIYILPQFASLTSDPDHSQVMVFEQLAPQSMWLKNCN
jgi:DNA-binding GntR family transcriptional regulator